VPAKSVIGKLPSGPAQRSGFTGNPFHGSAVKGFDAGRLTGRRFCVLDVQMEVERGRELKGNASDFRAGDIDEDSTRRYFGSWV
jgi:hypothetical protein